MLRGVVIRSAKAAWMSSDPRAIYMSYRCVQFSTEMTVDEDSKVINPQKYLRQVPFNQSSSKKVAKMILSVDGNRANQSRAAFLHAQTCKDKDEIIKVIKDARKNDTKLEFQEYLQGFSACSTIKDPSAVELSFYIFQQMIKNQYKVPIEVFEKLAIRIRHQDQLVALDHSFRSLGHRPTEIFIKHMLISISESQAPNLVLQKLLVEYYELYLVIQRTHASFRLDSTIYIAIATFFCDLHDSKTSLRVLQNMVDVHYEITVKRCERLFTMALIRREAAILRVLSRIYLDKVHSSSMLEIGELRRLMQIACTLGDDQLALLGFQVFSLFNAIYFFLLLNYLIYYSYYSYYSGQVCNKKS